MRTSKSLVLYIVLVYSVRYSTELCARGTHAPRFEIFAPRRSITNLASPTIIITFVVRLIVSKQLILLRPLPPVRTHPRFQSAVPLVVKRNLERKAQRFLTAAFATLASKVRRNTQSNDGRSVSRSVENEGLAGFRPSFSSKSCVPHG
jgi:hypothetical protein